MGQHGMETVAAGPKLVLRSQLGGNVACDSFDGLDVTVAVANRDGPVLDICICPVAPPPAPNGGAPRNPWIGFRGTSSTARTSSGSA